MAAEEQIAVRNAGLLTAQKGLHLLGGLLVAIVVPRLMGPDLYGRYALITSLSMWFALFSSMSAAQTMGRFVPQLVLAGDKEGLQKFLGNLLTVRFANGLFSATAYLLITALLFRELDTVALLFVAVAVCLRTSGKLIFAFFLGLNQAARWGAGEILRQWLSFALLVPGFFFGGLRGACLGLALSELLVLAVGMFFARSYLSWSGLGVDRRYVTPFLRFGFSFLASNVLLALSQRSGELLVRVASGDYVQVGYFGLAYKVYQLAGQAIWQLTMSFAPLLSSLRAQGKTDDIKRWVERLLKGVAVCGVGAIFSVLFLGGDVVPLILGADYAPVTDNLLVLMVALLTLALSGIARLLALTYDRPRIAVEAAALQFAVFWGLGVPLIAWRGGFAGCLAVLAASVVYSGYFTWRMRRVVRYSPGEWAMPILLGVMFLPLAWLRSTWQVNVALFVVAAVGYVAVLVLTKVIKPGEIASLRRAFRPVALAQDEG